MEPDGGESAETSVHNPRIERLVVLSILLLIAALSVPIYATWVATITARGVPLSWHQHLGLLGGAVLLGMGGVALFGLVLAVLIWLFEGTYWLWSGLQIWRRHRRRNSARRHAANQPPDGT